VDENIIFRLVVIVQRSKKIQMQLWDRPKAIVMVAAQGFQATIQKKRGRILACDIIGKHLLVIAPQKDRGWEGSAEFDQIIDDPGAVRTAIDIVTEKYDLVCVRGLNLVHQSL